MSAPALMSTVTGKCKWFDSKKGFGFITLDSDPEESVFVHQTAIHAEGYRSLAEDEPLEFEVVEENGKKKAISVTGPGGELVQGAPRQSSYDDDGRGGGYGRGGGGGGYNRGGGGGYGGGGGGYDRGGGY